MMSHHHFPEQSSRDCFSSNSDSYRLLSRSTPRRYEEVSACVSDSGDADVAMEGDTIHPSATNTNFTNMNTNTNANANANATANATASKLPHQQQHQQQPHRRRRLRKSRPLHPGNGGMGGGRIGGRRQRRLWQLPEAKILEYIDWIRKKPEADRTPNEERFLWKSMIRGLSHGNGSNSHCSNINGNRNNCNNYINTGSKRNKQDAIREIVQRTEAKARHERTEHEELFLRMFYKRRHKAQRKTKKHQTETETNLSWMRQSSSSSQSRQNQNHREGNNNNNNNNANANTRSGLEPMASLESLRESMNKMGLSSDNLKQVRFADPPKRGNDERR